MFRISLGNDNNVTSVMVALVCVFNFECRSKDCILKAVNCRCLPTYMERHGHRRLSNRKGFRRISADEMQITISNPPHARRNRIMEVRPCTKEYDMLFSCVYASRDQSAQAHLLTCSAPVLSTHSVSSCGSLFSNTALSYETFSIASLSYLRIGQFATTSSSIHRRLL